MGTSTLGVKRILFDMSLFTGVLFPLAFFFWKHIAFPPFIALFLVFGCYLLTIILLWLRFSLTETFWLKLWAVSALWLMSSLFAIPSMPIVPFLLILPMLHILLGMWGAYRFYPLRFDTRLHKARFARLDELSPLLSHAPCSDGFLMGKHKLLQQFVCVRPTKLRRELGNLLIVAPTRSGKGLLAISQLLSWQHSVIVNDIKGELFQATAGYRSTIGNVYVIDPTGVGHRYDPLLEKHTEDAFYSAATNLLFQSDEGEGAIFTQRATGMLSQLFAAARLEGIAPLPYVRSLIRLGLIDAAKRLNQVDPLIARQFLDVSFADANPDDRFLLSAWGTLTARMRPILTETVVRSLTTSDFTAIDLLCSDTPVTVYIRWKEQDLLALSPLVRLLWGSLIDELLTTYDIKQGKGCQPVLLLIDEAGRTAIPILADHATTVVGRGIYLWVAIQSLSQLDAVYGKARSQILRDNMENQIYHRPTDLATAQYLEIRTGTRSAYAHSHTMREGEEKSQGLSERPIPLMTAQEIMQLRDEEIIGFHRRLPPFKMRRVEWWKYSLFRKRRDMPLPVLPTLPPVLDIGSPFKSQAFSTSHRFADPDTLREKN